MPILSKILVVDDNSQNLRVITDRLTNEGYNVVQAPGGKEALEKVASEKPDLIVLDILMPGMDGFEVITALKADRQTVLIPIIAVTALHERADKIRAIELGADDFITKPPDKVELLTRIRSLLRIKQLQDELKAQAEALSKANRELQEAQTELVRAERLAAIGQVGIAVKHEINNPLTAILGEAQLLLMQHTDLPERIVERIRVIEGMSLRISDIVQKLHDITDDRTVDYLDGIKMIDIRGGDK